MSKNPTAVPSTLESLLAHADWVRALARHLVHDPQTADDIEQEVWRAALERPPHHAENPRGWLAAAARNAARALKRGEGRRTRRETLAARPEALPSSAQLIEEAELSRELAGIVLQLDEPYRTTILLRYIRDLTIEEIASAQDTPRETIRTRQRRALELLRQRLDATHGGRAAWTAAFAPLVRVESSPVLVGSGYAGLAWALAALLLTTGVWLAWPKQESAPPLAALPTPEATGDEDTSRLEAPSVPRPDRVDASVGQPRPPAPGPEGLAAPRESGAEVLGRVIDVSGRPLAGVELVMTPKYAAHLEGDVVVVPEPPHLEDGTRVEELGVDVVGTVYGGESRVPISAREREAIQQSPEILQAYVTQLGGAPGLREALLGLPQPRVTARTDLEGRFRARLDQATWVFDVNDEHAVIVAELGARSSPDWTLVVAPAIRVVGYVVDEAGAPLPEASVQHMSSSDALRDLFFERKDGTPRYASTSPLVDARGRFELPKVPRFPRDTIEVRARGYRGATMPVPEQDTLDLRIVLQAERTEDQPKQRLRGIVVDATGRPAAGASVHLGHDQCLSGEDGRFDLELSCCHDRMPLAATLLGFQPALIRGFGRPNTPSQDDLVLRLGPPTLRIRGHVTGPTGKPIAKARVQILDGEVFSNIHCFAEDVAVGRYVSGVLSDVDGGFELAGLSARDYLVGAWWGDEFVVVSDPVRAGTEGLVLRIDPSRTWPEVRGRVVSRIGTPLSDVEIGVRLDTYRSPGSSDWRTFGNVSTDGNGSFVLSNVPKSFVGLALSGRAIRTETLDLPADPTRVFTITATLEVRIELEAADQRVDEVRFLDAAGKSVQVKLQLPGLVSQRDGVSRRGGTFPPFDLTDESVTAVLWSHGAEVRRIPIRIERVATLRLQL